MPSDTNRSEETRQILIDQIAHLIDEVEALRTQLHLIPEQVLSARPMESEPSFIEIYKQLVRFDEAVILPAIRKITNGQTPQVVTLGAPETLPQSVPSNADISAVLDDLQSGRKQLVSTLKSLPVSSWREEVLIEDESADVFALAYLISQHDAAILQKAAHRLHESRLSQRKDDSSK